MDESTEASHNFRHKTRDRTIQNGSIFRTQDTQDKAGKDSPENLLLVLILLEVDGDWLAAPDVGPGGRPLDPQDRDIPGHPKIHPEGHIISTTCLS